jgi:2-oxoglutarate dehydrogenase E2 component (dihydrolipoamide succinyltransferase)
MDVKIPTVGESITEVTLAQWLKKDGDHVEQDELICEIESDKASFELNAEQPGILHTKANEGDTIAVGSVIATIDTEGAAKTGQPEQKTGKAPEAPAQENQPAEQAPSQEPKEQKSTPAEKQSYASGSPSPAAQKILDEKNIPATEVKGTGRDGRITKDDAVKTQASGTAKTEEPQKQPEPKQEPAKKAVEPQGQEKPKAQVQPQNAPAAGERNIRREKMTTLRKTIARRLVDAKNLTAMLTTFNEVDMTAVMEMRKKYKDAFKDKYGIGLGFMSLFTRAACEAIKDFPAVNAMIDENDLVYHDYVDVGVAVSTPRGLVVPVIRNAESMSLAQIEMQIADLATRARDNKLAIDEMTGGTFTITNGGVFGSLMSTPIINAPQSAILGMHNIVDRPIALNGEVVIRPMMYIALSYDHRVIDGRESVGFLLKIKQYIEDPARMLLEV